MRCGACCRPPVSINGHYCEHFIDGDPATCAIYEQRPTACRNWPHPKVTQDMLDPTCGFRVVDD